MQTASRDDVNASRLGKAYKSVRLAQELARIEGRSEIEMAAKTAGDEVKAVASDLLARGAEPDRAPEPLSELSLLMVLDSPSSRALLAGLKELLPLGRAVDVERGNTLEAALPDGQRGLDWEEDLLQLVARLSGEVQGAGSVRE